MKKFTTPKKIRAELQRLSYKAHGKRVMASFGSIITEAHIHCVYELEDDKIRWDFCQIIKDGRNKNFDNTMSFRDNDDGDNIHWFYWLDNELDFKITPSDMLKIGKHYWDDDYHPTQRELIELSELIETMVRKKIKKFTK